MALERETYTVPPTEKTRLARGASDQRSASRRAVAVAPKRRAWARVEPPPVQILVAVARTHVRTVWAEVEKGSM